MSALSFEFYCLSTWWVEVGWLLFAFQVGISRIQIEQLNFKISSYLHLRCLMFLKLDLMKGGWSKHEGCTDWWYLIAPKTRHSTLTSGLRNSGTFPKKSISILGIQILICHLPPLCRSIKFPDCENCGVEKGDLGGWRGHYRARWHYQTLMGGFQKCCRHRRKWKVSSPLQ